MSPRPPRALIRARQEGSARYFTGRPCRRGHVAKRLTSNKTCTQCHAEKEARRYAANAERIKTKVRAYVERNKQKKAAADAAYQKANRTRLSAYYSERYRRKKPELLAKVKAYRAARPGFAAEVGRAYIARKVRAMPVWVDRESIRAVYRKAAAVAAETGERQAVDHVYPLKGKDACGLHVPWNLQVMPFVDNCRKGTKSPTEWKKAA